MSYSTVLAVTPNKRPAALAEFRNSHGWSPSIWRRLIKANYGFDGYPFHGEGERHMNDLWQTIETLPEWQQAPLVLTFDTGVIPYQEFKWAADQLEEFERRLPENPDYVNHVPTLVEILRSGPEAPLLGVWGTSVTENPFDPWDEEADDHGSGISLAEMYVLERHRSLVIGTFRPTGSGSADPRPDEGGGA